VTITRSVWNILWIKGIKRARYPSSLDSSRPTILRVRSRCSTCNQRQYHAARCWCSAMWRARLPRSGSANEPLRQQDSRLPPATASLKSGSAPTIDNIDDDLSAICQRLRGGHIFVEYLREGIAVGHIIKTKCAYRHMHFDWVEILAELSRRNASIDQLPQHQEHRGPPGLDN
jgi:hypothetical protein